MADLQFLVLAGLRLCLVWRTRVIAQIPPWIRDALLRKIFEQLNGIESLLLHAPDGLVEETAERWWINEKIQQAGKSWYERRRCGPWCHEDWHTPGIRRAVEIDNERQHRGWKSEEAKKEEFEGAKLLAKHYPFELGVLYASGWGVAKDQNEALLWYRKAAENGDRRAQYNLAAAYFEGDGVPVDYAAAYFWLKLRDMGQGVDAVGDFLTLEERTEIENRARKWFGDRAAGANPL